MRKHSEIVNNKKKEDRSGHLQDVQNENKNFHQHPQFNHNPAEEIETEIDLDIEDSRISSKSLVKELIRRLSVNELPRYQQKVSPDLSFIAERYKIMNMSREQFVIGRRSSFEGKLSEFKPQSLIEKDSTEEHFKYLTSEEVPPILRKYDKMTLPRSELTHDKYTPLHRLTTYQQRDQIGTDIKSEDVKKFIDTVHFDEIKPDENEEDQQSFHAIENLPRRSFDRRGSYLPSTSAGQPVSISKISNGKPSDVTAEDIEKYKAFQLRSTLRDQNKPKNSFNK